MKEFDLQKDMNTVCGNSIDCNMISAIVSHYACETSMDLDDELSIDIGIGTLLVKKDIDEILYSFIPSTYLTDAVANGFNGKSALVSMAYKTIDKLIKGV